MLNEKAEPSQSIKLRLVILIFVAVASGLVLWKVGYNIMWQRAVMEFNGRVILSKDFPETGAPGYVTAYAFKADDGTVKDYVATDDKAALERSMPMETLINKKKWDFGYFKNDQWISFISPIYPLSVAAGVAGMLWTLFAAFCLLLNKLKKTGQS